MPADFGEIFAYHHQEAARLYARAQEAHERGSLAEAIYLAGQAARWEEAALEQKTEMCKLPRHAASQSPFLTVTEGSLLHARIRWPMTIVRGAWRAAVAVGQFLFKRQAPFTGLMLR